MNIETLRDLFVYELSGLYCTERTLAERLDQFADETAVNSLDEASDGELRDALSEAFAEHRDETETHVERLERVFESVDHRPEERAVPALDGLAGETERLSNVVLNDAVRPLFYLDAGSKVERLEIRTYESMIETAEALGIPDDAVEALEANLRDERDALAELEYLSESSTVESLRETLTADSPDL